MMTPPDTATDPELCPERLSKIREFVRQKIESDSLPGAVTLIERHGKTVYQDVQGWQDIENKLPMRADCIFRIYSLTKIVTSVAVLILYEEGALDLNDPVSRYIPVFANPVVEGTDGKQEAAERDMTLYDLLRHCGGLRKSHNLEELLRSSHTLTTFCDELAEQPLAAQPGTTWRYGNSTDVLARVVEIVSNTSYEDFLQTRIFHPLGMTDTVFRLLPDQQDRYTVCYHYNKSGQRSIHDPADGNSLFCGNSPFRSGAAGLLSTPNDYMTFCRMLLRQGAYPGGHLLGRKTVELMTSDHLPPGHPNLEIGIQSFRFGLGVSVMTHPARSRSLASAGEFGWGGATGTQIWINPVEDMIVMIMIQVRAEIPTGIMDMVKRLAYQSLIPCP